MLQSHEGEKDPLAFWGKDCWYPGCHKKACWAWDKGNGDEKHAGWILVCEVQDCGRLVDVQ